MRRAAAAFVVVFVGSALAASPPARGQDADQESANADFKEFQAWLEQANPKDAAERAALRVEVTKRARAFLKSHPQPGAAAFAVRDALADALYESHDFKGSLAEAEPLAKADDAKWAAAGRRAVVKALIRLDLKAARTRLDAYLKDHPDERGLVEADKVLKDFERGKPLKVGEAPPEFTTKTLAGEDFSFSKLTGKIALVDFWATWCPPCKKELPNLKKLYSELHAKGFEIVGVDFGDRDIDKLKEFLTKEQVAWPQLVADAKPIARAYHVEALPRTVLLGRDGKVAALDLRGERLAKAIRALLDGKPIPPDDGEGEGDEGLKAKDLDGEK
jgi:thiol-disulfide isomerase/thioredoxin